MTQVSLAGGAPSIIFVMTKVCGKTHLLSQLKYACRNKTFVVTKICLSQQNCCCDKYLLSVIHCQWKTEKEERGEFLQSPRNVKERLDFESAEAVHLFLFAWSIVETWRLFLPVFVFVLWLVELVFFLEDRDRSGEWNPVCSTFCADYTSHLENRITSQNEACSAKTCLLGLSAWFGRKVHIVAIGLELLHFCCMGFKSSLDLFFNILII